MEYPSIADRIAQKVKSLPTDKQLEVLDFVESLRSRSDEKLPRPTGKGLWSDLGIKITEEEIAQARKEMWSGFPREDI
jgi:hypothetical protein